MFKIATTPSYIAPVTVELPGSKIKNVFDAEFRRLSQDEIQRLNTRVSAGEVDDKAFCNEVMIGWAGVTDEDGAEIEFSVANLEKLLAIYPVPASIVQAFFASLSGARAKN